MSTTVFCDKKFCYISAQEFLGPIRFDLPHFEFLTQFSLRFDEFRFGFQTILELFVGKLGNTATR